MDRETNELISNMKKNLDKIINDLSKCCRFVLYCYQVPLMLLYRCQLLCGHCQMIVLWNVAGASCMRVIPNPTGAEVLCCRFQPLNNNLFVVSFHTLCYFTLLLG